MNNEVILDLERGVTLTAGVALTITGYVPEDNTVEVVLASRIRTSLKIVSGDHSHVQTLVNAPALYLDISGKVIEPIKIQRRTPDPLAALMY